VRHLGVVDFHEERDQCPEPIDGIKRVEEQPLMFERAPPGSTCSSVSRLR
jgi:hypothetical protein